MKPLFTLLFLLVQFSSFAQFEIGHTTITFNDPARSGGFGSGGGPGRQIQTEIYYPAITSGTDVSLADDIFPVIVFGHGFVMAWDAYANIWETLVPLGYIIAFPRTEGGFTPSHEEFGLDLAIVENSMRNKGVDNTSLFYSHISDYSAIMGHSMGGGSSILAAASNPNISTVIGLAPAETTPSAITAATNVTVPAFIMSGGGDAVTPADEHHLPIYNALGSTCKYFTNIIGGAHCYFANSNFNCDFGEGSSGGTITIDRNQQHAIMFRYVIPWLDLHLKNDCSQSSVFETDIQNDSEVSYLSECTTGLVQPMNLGISSGSGTLIANQTDVTYQWINCSDSQPIIGANEQTFTPTMNGSYAVILGSGTCAETTECITIGSLELTHLKIDQTAEIVKYYNSLGQEVHPTVNTLLIAVYANGMRKKIVIVED